MGCKSVRQHIVWHLILHFSVLPTNSKFCHAFTDKRTNGYAEHRIGFRKISLEMLPKLHEAWGQQATETLTMPAVNISRVHKRTNIEANPSAHIWLAASSKHVSPEMPVGGKDNTMPQYSLMTTLIICVWSWQMQCGAVTKIGKDGQEAQQLYELFYNKHTVTV